MGTHFKLLSKEVHDSGRGIKKYKLPVSAGQTRTAVAHGLGCGKERGAVRGPAMSEGQSQA